MAAQKNIRTIDFLDEIKVIKNEIRIPNRKVFIDGFSCKYKPDGDIINISLYLVSFNANDMYDLIVASYSSERGSYKVEISEHEDWFMFDELVDEKCFGSYMKRFDCNEFKPNINNCDYEYLKIYYSNERTKFTSDTEDEIFFVQDEKVIKLSGENLSAEGFPIFVVGIKQVKNEEFIEEIRIGSSVYLFNPKISKLS